MTRYILTEDETRVIGTGISGVNAELPDDDARVVAWLAAQSPSAPVNQIKFLEAKVTPRMIQEALSGSALTFSGGPYAGKTSAQVIAEIRSQIDVLRAQL